MKSDRKRLRKIFTLCGIQFSENDVGFLLDAHDGAKVSGAEPGTYVSIILEADTFSHIELHEM